MPTRLAVDDPALMATAKRTVVPGDSTIAQILNLLGISPAGAVTAPAGAIEPALQQLGKPVSEMLGATFTTPNNTGLPKRLTVSGWNSLKGTVGMHGQRAGAEAMEATPGQLDQLIGEGHVGLEQPPEGAVQAIMAKLRAALGASAGK